MKKLKLILNSIFANPNKNKKLDSDSLMKLSNDDLYEAIYFKLLDFVESCENEESALAVMNENQKAFYVLSLYDSEIQNGGLAQFFSNSTSTLAPFVSGFLEKMNLKEHKNLFDDFLRNNNIDLTRESLEDFFAFYDIPDQYWEDFDENYADLSDMQNALGTLVRQNINDF